MLLRHLIGRPVFLVGPGLLAHSRNVPRAETAAGGSDWRRALPGFVITVAAMVVIG
ncbi:hypothetical protein AB0C76_00025 [Kitasatospora sp. NPDC048722]|uniref:hypothetical protein n=1 Tax=Kitasatospora sp. NPDC048722 TaxID=3155639 RepID=UPI003407531D